MITFGEYVAYEKLQSKEEVKEWLHEEMSIAIWKIMKVLLKNFVILKIRLNEITTRILIQRYIRIYMLMN